MSITRDTRAHDPHGRTAVLAAAILLSALAPAALADGSETLGAPSLAIADGTAVIAAGVGLLDGQPGTIQLEIPGGVQIRQVIAYWEGQNKDFELHGTTDDIQIRGLAVTGDRIGGPIYLFSNVYGYTYRADITDLALVGVGTNFISVSGLDFRQNMGAGLVVIVDDGSAATIELRDGVDFAYEFFAAPRDLTVAQTFTVDPAALDRAARLNLFTSSIELGLANVVRISIDGEVAETLVDVLGDLDGPQWDTLHHELTLPAGATSVTVEVVSADAGTGPNAGAGSASLTWLFASFEAESSIDPNEGCSPHFWLCHTGLWDGAGGDDVTSGIHHYDHFNQTMGLSGWRTGMFDHWTLRHALYGYGGWWWWHKLLNRHAAAALANADSGLNYEFSVDEVIGLYRDAVGGDQGPETIKSALIKLALANARVCPL